MVSLIEIRIYSTYIFFTLFSGKDYVDLVAAIRLTVFLLFIDCFIFYCFVANFDLRTKNRR